jgi:catechol 2,3-dioxygenase-like lactoylglutathione lyase family enzyme
MPVDVRGQCPLLMVFDMPESLAFYRDVLGFTVTGSAGPPGDTGWAMLAMNGVEIMLNTQYELPDRPPGRDPVRVAAHADTVIYFGAPEPDAVYAHLRDRGVAVQPPGMTGYGFRAVSVSDPDGYGLCFHWPATREAWDGWVERYGIEPRAFPLDASEAT